ncbi:hypothetical protein F511_16947 [Dorcoceras hygrometricum]|uniref:Uncharacterized protein n=1 Tax=Dorcoceras hygrometricum TaxID=472368 RepID=A0A2Z7CZX3_9LAMI|nr:hypothetical protein F511_16947 [Dorcoceras hygrometricum]
MTSSLISISHHIDFDSVFGIDDTALVQMFETLIATGLKEFLGCPAVFYDAALTEFFKNSSVRDGVVVSTIRGTAIEISENIFTTTFGLPTEGLTDFSEVPKDLVFYARSLFSVSKEQVSISGLKKEIKIQYRLLSDILAKTLYVKAGSFDAVTRNRFMLMTAITFDVKVNWSSLLIDESYLAKEELVLTWAEAESTGVALNRKRYILLKYREMLLRKFLEARRINFAPGDGSSAIDLKILDRLSDIHSFVLEELKKETQAHGLTWKKTCFSKIFEGVEPRAAHWVKIPQPVVQNEVPRQRSYDDTLPPVSKFFKLMKKRWADVCLEAVELVGSRIMLPVGSVNFCRALSVVEPVSSFDYHRSTTFSLSVSQFCTVFFEYSLFRRFSSEDITSFVSFIASERTNLRSVQITTPSAVAPVPILLDQRSSSTSSSDESMHFDDQDTATAFSLPAATLPSLPAVTTELSTSLDDLRIFLSERFHNQAEATRLIDDAQSDVLSRLHTIKRDILAALMQQEEAFRNLINTARQDGRTLDDEQTLRFNEFRKVVLAQSLSSTADMLEVRKEIKALDAKVTSLDEQVAATRNDLLEFRAQAQQTLNIVTDQLSELVAYINRGGNDKKGEVSSSRPPPDDQNRGSGNTGGGGDTDRKIV